MWALTPPTDPAAKGMQAWFPNTATKRLLGPFAWLARRIIAAVSTECCANTLGHLEEAEFFPEWENMKASCCLECLCWEFLSSGEDCCRWLWRILVRDRSRYLRRLLKLVQIKRTSRHRKLQFQWHLLEYGIWRDFNWCNYFIDHIAVLGFLKNHLSHRIPWWRGCCHKRRCWTGLMRRRINVGDKRLPIDVDDLLLNAVCHGFSHVLVMLKEEIGPEWRLAAMCTQEGERDCLLEFMNGKAMH